MKKFSLLSLITLFTLIASSFKGEEYQTMEIGAKAPMVDYEMKGTDGNQHSLESLAQANGLLVIFSCNTCPFVIKWEDRYPGLAKMAAEQKIGFALINSNEAKRNGEDSMEEMKKHASEKGYANVPYVVDENSQLANAFGAKTTPHVFLFNKEMELVYEGAIDDNLDSAAAVEKAYLSDAMDNMLKGKEIDPANTKAIGCSIKRVKG
jgi:thioredoxin-related protein